MNDEHEGLLPPPREPDPDEETRRAERTTHQRMVTADRAYARRIDEREIRERAGAAFDQFVAMGFTVHLIAVQVRGAVEYRLALYPDGQRTLAIEVLREVALDFNFDLRMEQDPSYETGWNIILYPLA